MVDEVPEELAAALAGDAVASSAFSKLSAGHRREYTSWVAEAKKSETRVRRAAEAVQRLRATGDSGLIPMWRTATRAEAVEILRLCREGTDELVARVPPAKLSTATCIGGGAWSVKDLVGHLASCEEEALVVLGLRRPPKDAPHGRSVDEVNAFNIERKRRWSFERVGSDAVEIRAALLTAIEQMDDERWRAKVETTTGRSALGLVLAKKLSGERFGYFAHDLAHRKDLERAVEQLAQSELRGGGG